jgi:hypothetical protein
MASGDHNSSPYLSSPLSPTHVALLNCWALRPETNAEGASSTFNYRDSFVWPRLYQGDIMMRRVLMAVGALLCVGLAAAQAHENRQVGSYTLTVGFRIEPAFEDVVNAIDIFVNRTSDGKAISVRDGDVLALSVEVQVRERDDFDADILAAAHLQENPRQDFTTSNRYNAWFKPTHDGAYAFRVVGVIEDASDAAGVGPQAIDETFVCGNGTQSDSSRFNCVEDPQTFPGKSLDGYRNNAVFSLE